MTIREIRATLRGACSEKMINGWNGPMVGQAYVIAPLDGETQNWSATEAAEFCEMLQAAGAEPLYRESEPDPYPWP